MSTNVPGSQVNQAAITPICVNGRGEEGAWLEACQRLAESYTEVLAGWANQPVKPTLYLTLTMERPSVGEASEEFEVDDHLHPIDGEEGGSPIQTYGALPPPWIDPETGLPR